jgi:hypothetical protein
MGAIPANVFTSATITLALIDHSALTFIAAV